MPYITESVSVLPALGYSRIWQITCTPRADVSLSCRARASQRWRRPQDRLLNKGNFFAMLFKFSTTVTRSTITRRSGCVAPLHTAIYYGWHTHCTLWAKGPRADVGSRTVCSLDSVSLWLARVHSPKMCNYGNGSHQRTLDRAPRFQVSY